MAFSINNKRREVWVNIQPGFLNKLYSAWFPFQYCVYNRSSPGVFDNEQAQTKGGFISRCIMLSQQPSNGQSFNLNLINYTYIFSLMVPISCLLTVISLAEDAELLCITVVWKWLWAQWSREPDNAREVKLSVSSNISHYSGEYFK